MDRASIHPLLISKGAKPRKGEVRDCVTCGTVFYVQPCHLLNNRPSGHGTLLGPRKFCSKKCAVTGMLTNNSLTCVVCAKPFYVSVSQQTLRARKTCSRRCRARLLVQRGENRRKTQPYTQHQLDRIARYSAAAREWRQSVFARDDYTCQNCNTRGGYLEADHIMPFAFFPGLRYELSNGRTLCRGCHDKTKMSYKKMREIYLGIGEDAVAEVERIGRENPQLDYVDLLAIRDGLRKELKRYGSGQSQ